MTASTSLDPFLKKYLDSFHVVLKQCITNLGEETNLKKACEYTLMSNGKRFRPIIALLVAESLGNNLDVMQAAIALELMHSSSLIIDDLPCMDDDDFRRGKPSLHKVFGETTALLASYALMNLAYEKIHDAAMILQLSNTPFSSRAQQVCMIALGEASKAAGIFGATGGQFFDLFPPEKNLPMIRKVIYQKTVCLFEITFLFGFLFGGGDHRLVDVVKNAAGHFGMAFQIADDLRDQKQDAKRDDEMNLALFLGERKARDFFEEEMNAFIEKISSLSLNEQPFLLLKEQLFLRVSGACSGS